MYRDNLFNELIVDNFAGGGAYDTDGLWKPTKEGLGMAHCIDEINKVYGANFIRY